MSDCPSTLAWDDHDIHGTPFSPAVVHHLESCARCHDRQQQRQVWRDRFEARHSTPLRSRLASARLARPTWRWLLALALPAAAAAGFALVTRIHGPGGPYRAVKGAVGVEVAGRRHGRVFAFDAGQAAEPGDELQLTIRAAGDLRYVLVGSVDGTGTFSPFYPGSRAGQSVPLPPAGRPLEPPIVLDDAPGPEHLLVVVSDTPLAASAVAAVAESAPARTERLQIPGVPAAVRTAARWITLPKRAAGR